MIRWERRRVRVQGVELAVQRGHHPRGSGRPVLLFLHEALGSIAQWKRFPERLAERVGCDLVVYERPGHGASDPLVLPRPDDYLEREGRRALPALVTALGLERVILVGHSDGGTLALLGAAAMPERVAGVITEAAHVFVEAETRAGIWDAVEQGEALCGRLARHHGDKTDALFRAWHETWLRPSFQALDLTGGLAGIRCPALVIQGRGDQYGTEAQVEAICAGIGPLAEPLWLDAAHCPHFEAGDACLAAMAAFIDRLLPAPARLRSGATG